MISCPLIIRTGPTEAIEFSRDRRDYPLCCVTAFKASGKNITVIHPLLFNVITFCTFEIVTPNSQRLYPLQAEDRSCLVSLIQIVIFVEVFFSLLVLREAVFHL